MAPEVRLFTVTHFYESHGSGIERVATQLNRELVAHLSILVVSLLATVFVFLLNYLATHWAILRAARSAWNWTASPPDKSQ